MPRSLKQSLRGCLETAYGIYSVLLFVTLALATLLIVMLPLGIRARRSVAHATALSFFWLAGMRLRVTDEAHLPRGACMVVANHASYLDGVVLKAALPARFSFVIKKEVSSAPLAGLLLRRIGSEFVDRFNRHKGAMDTRRLIKSAAAGQALAFFPEGTFLPHPGVGKFHTGAFAIATRAGLPVVPVAIRGTRAILPAKRLLPRPGRIDVQVLPAIGPLPDTDSSSATTLAKTQARARIVAALGEPDLSDTDGVAALEAARKS